MLTGMESKHDDVDRQTISIDIVEEIVTGMRFLHFYNMPFHT